MLVVFVLGLGLAMAFYHAAIQHPLNTQVGGAGDADEYSWFLAWVPYALEHGINPLISHYLNAPGGINLMWNTSVILPSVIMAPFTAIFGAAFSYNVLVISAPTLTITFSYIAFRRWTGRLPALVGALIVGFSPYIIAQSAGHLAQILIMSAPLLLILLDRVLVVQSGTAWVDGLLLGTLAFAQLLTGEEVLAMEAVVGGLAVVALGLIAHRRVAAHFAYAARALLTSGVAFLVFSAPYLAYQYLGPYRVQDVHPPNAYVTDLLNFIVPTNVQKLAPVAALHISSHFTGNGSEDNGYIGIPLVVFMILTLVLAGHRRVTWVAAGVAFIAGILSMGPTLHWYGHVSQHNLPDYYLQKLPIVHNLLPDRFASMMVVGVGLLVAVGCDELKRLVRPAMAVGWIVVAAGLAALFPITDFPAAASPIWTAFSSGLACPANTSTGRGALPPVVLVVPTINEMDLRWQAEGKFCFVMPTATGMTGTNSGDVQGQGVLLKLGDPYAPPEPLTAALRVQAAQEIAQLHISEIVVAPEFPTSPVEVPQQQAQQVIWIDWLLGQYPVPSHDQFLSYVWKNLPPASDIAAGHVPQLPKLPPP